MYFFRRFGYLFLSALFLLAIFTTSAQDNDEIAGVWHTEGYAWLFDISPTAVTAYQVTDATCVTVFASEDIVYEANSVLIPNAQLPGIAALLADPSDVLLTLDGGKLLIEDGIGGVVPIYAVRTETLPAYCLQTTVDAEDPETNFEHIWNIFAENYAFFDLYGVDWQQVYETYRPQVTPDTTQEELFDIVQQALSGMSDAHINLIASPTQVYSPGQYAEWTQNQDEDVITAYVMLILEKYLIDEPQILANEQIIYGHLSDTVGYINFLSMYEFGTDGDDIAALESAMTTLQADLSDVQSIVIDVRFNPGGDDANALFIASYFADKSTLAFSKQAWDRTGFLEQHDLMIEPADGPHFTQAVYLLISNFTTSAGEVFTMTMTALPSTIAVGETTQGAFSDILPVFLPNGWLATLSNERYVSHDGSVYEGLGLPPVIEIPMTSESLTTGKDPVIDQILEMIAAQ